MAHSALRHDDHYLSRFFFPLLLFASRGRTRTAKRGEMSKKKGFTGSTTMTLKDFHGGSIPSDLPLPSAPGASFRASDRTGAWGYPGISRGGPSGTISLGRSDHLRPRPGSAGGSLGGGGTASGARSLDERPPTFLSHIGRHFDEDERKPFDASSVPRRSPAPDAASRAPLAAAPDAARSDPKRPISSPVTYPPLGGSSAASPNAWGARKDVVSEPTPSAAQSTWSASRIAQASAVEKVSSGLWQSKPTPEVEVIRYQETEVLDRRFGEIVRVADGNRENGEGERLRSVLSAAAYEEPKETFYSGRDNRVQERGRLMSHQETRERNAPGIYYNESARPVSNDGQFAGQKIPEQGVEVPERPKLKLPPRMKPVESPDTPTHFSDDKQVHQLPASSMHVQNVHEVQGNVNTIKPTSIGGDNGNQAVERPKLNLKPRTQPVEQLVVSNEKERNALFGGARPRELVLKERGIDVAASDREVTVQSNRDRNDLQSDIKQEPTPASSQPGERAESIPHRQRSGRDVEGRNYHSDAERVDGQRSSWKNDNRRNTRDIEKPLEQPRAELETWRKKIEQPKVENRGPVYGKVASSLELAQAFSRSMSDDRAGSSSMNSRTIPGRPQVPFSRLTSNRELYSGSNQRQINGY